MVKAGMQPLLHLKRIYPNDLTATRSGWLTPLPPVLLLCLKTTEQVIPYRHASMPHSDSWTLSVLKTGSLLKGYVKVHIELQWVSWLSCNLSFWPDWFLLSSETVPHQLCCSNNSDHSIVTYWSLQEKIWRSNVIEFNKIVPFWAGKSSLLIWMIKASGGAFWKTWCRMEDKSKSHFIPLCTI